MKRTPLHRAGVLALAATFVLGSAQSAVAELGCGHHGAAHGTGAHDRVSSDIEEVGGHLGHDQQHEHGHDGHTHGHDGPDHAHPDSGSHHSDHEDAHGCTCVGSCAGGGGIALDVAKSGNLLFGHRVGRAKPFARGAAGPRATPRLLPFANAPPFSR